VTFPGCVDARVVFEPVENGRCLSPQGGQHQLGMLQEDPVQAIGMAVLGTNEL